MTLGHRHLEERLAFWTLLAPGLGIYVLVMAFPPVVSVVLSLSDYHGGRLFGGGNPWRLTGLEQYAALLNDPQFWLSLKNNVYIILVSVFGQIPLGFFLAYLLYRRLVRAPGLWQGLLYLPVILSTIVIGSLWGALFSPYGPVADLVNQLYQNDFHGRLTAILGTGDFRPTDADIVRLLAAADPRALATSGIGGLDDMRTFLSGYGPDQLAVARDDLTRLLAARFDVSWMDTPDVAMLPVLFVILWQWTGFYLVLFLANMQRIDAEIIEAAQIDGASELQILRRIIVPALSGVVVTAAIFAISGSLRSFDVIWAMNGDKAATQVLSVYTYRTAFAATPNYPLANAISAVMVVISFLLIGITRAVEARWGGRT